MSRWWSSLPGPMRPTGSSVSKSEPTITSSNRSAPKSWWRGSEPCFGEPTQPGSGAEIIRAGGMTLDVPRREVRVDDKTVVLTATEFDLLHALARQPGRVFTRGQLLEAIHGVAFESYERAIDAHVKNIRRKLEPEPQRPRLL